MEKVSYFGLREPRTLLRVIKGSNGTRGFLATPSSPRWQATEALLEEISLGADTEVYDLSQKEALFILDRWGRPKSRPLIVPPATEGSIVASIMLAVEEFMPAAAPTVLPEPLVAPDPPVVPEEDPIPTRLERDEVMNLFKDLGVGKPERLPERVAPSPPDHGPDDPPPRLKNAKPSET